MIKIELAFGTAAEAAQALALLAGNTPKPEAQAPKDKPTTGKSNSAAGAGEPSSAKPQAAASTKSTETTPQSDVPTYEKSGIPEKIKALVATKKDDVIKLLAEFGAKKGGDLKPEQFKDFTAKIDALAAAGEDLS